MHQQMYKISTLWTWAPFNANLINKVIKHTWRHFLWTQCKLLFINNYKTSMYVPMHEIKDMYPVLWMNRWETIIYAITTGYLVVFSLHCWHQKFGKFIESSRIRLNFFRIRRKIEDWKSAIWFYSSNNCTRYQCSLTLHRSHLIY